MPASSSDTWPIPLKQHISALLFITVTVLTANLVSRTQPIPYLDEIFHIPQAQRFCSALAKTSLFAVQDVWSQLRSVKYDAQLTTPPGLYAISVGLAKVLPGWECTDALWLRSTNLVLLLTLPVLVARILRQNEEQAGLGSVLQQSTPNVTKAKKKEAVSRSEIEKLQAKARLEQPPTPDASQDELPDIDPPTITVAHNAPVGTTSASKLPRGRKRKEATPYTMAVACTICFLPPLWFFGFMYYTDLASAWLVLACLTLYNDLNASNQAVVPTGTGVLIAVASVMAVSVRQTNIVWIGFAAAQALLARVGSLTRTAEGSSLAAQVGAVAKAATREERKEFWKAVAVNAAPMVPVLAVCAAFLRWNGSIVLGDKTAHQVALHLPHMGYFLAFASAFGLSPLLFSLQSSSLNTESESKSTLAAFTRSVRAAVSVVASAAFGSATGLLTLAATLAAFYVAADRFTIEHPYLLSDNRHYTSYIWRRYRKTYTIPGLGGVAIRPKLAVVPLFALALVAWTSALSRHAQRGTGTGALFNLLFWLATAAALVPTPLIEPRYFLMAYLLLRIFSQPKAKQRDERLKWVYLGLEVATYAVVNVVTVGLFVLKPFEWKPDAVDTSRGESTTMRYLW